MSLKTLPLLFLNLGGEMMYILDQRLRAQNIPSEKAQKVMNDIVNTMLNKRFMEELFKPQEVYSKKALRTIFDKLAHASIMRLNSASMDKLYDLMTMAFKHQVYMCPRPFDLILITLNHLDNIRKFTTSVDIQQQVNDAYSLLIQHYANMSHGSFQLIRFTLLSFFQDNHVRVSLFLKNKVQMPNGRFIMPTYGHVPLGAEVPGVIRFYDSSGNVKETVPFLDETEFLSPLKAGSLDVIGDRVTALGSNIYLHIFRYKAAKAAEAQMKTETVSVPIKSPTTPVEPAISKSDPNSKYATDELNLFASLIGSSPTHTKAEFRLNLFETDAEEEIAGCKAVQKDETINIDTSQGCAGEELTKIINEMMIQEPCGEGDAGGDSSLLDLMDIAST